MKINDNNGSNGRQYEHEQNKIVDDKCDTILAAAFTDEEIADVTHEMNRPFLIKIKDGTEEMIEKESTKILAANMVVLGNLFPDSANVASDEMLAKFEE